jgi:SAM-dependent methyltransferase
MVENPSAAPRARTSKASAVARRARTWLYRGLTALERQMPGFDPLLPPAHLRVNYYRTLRRAAFDKACAGAREELVSRGLRPEHSVLDVGSGIGNLAVGLLGFLERSYDGVDVNAEAVTWCQRAITSRHPSFRFHHMDVASGAYNPGGRLSAPAHRFPFSDGRFDCIFLGSVFTHMLPDGVARYVDEIARLLAPGGMCIASYFLLNGESRTGVSAGRSFMTFGVEHGSGLCRLHRESVPEAAVAIEEDYVREVHEKAGLLIRDVRRGRWWSGESDDQDILTVTRMAQ